MCLKLSLNKRKTAPKITVLPTGFQLEQSRKCAPSDLSWTWVALSKGEGLHLAQKPSPLDLLRASSTSEKEPVGDVMKPSPSGYA